MKPNSFVFDPRYFKRARSDARIQNEPAEKTLTLRVCTAELNQPLEMRTFQLVQVDEAMRNKLRFFESWI